MTDLTDTRIRRGLLVLIAASLALSVVGPAAAQSKGGKGKGKAKQQKIQFEPGTDLSSWYWSKQVDEEVTTPVPLPPPAPPASQRVRLPNPQNPDTVPVGLDRGEVDKMSAVKFSLLERGVTDGSKIEKLVLHMQESQDNDEQPQVNPDTAVIQACQIIDFFPAGENEQFDDAPKFVDAGCAEGTRDPEADPAPVWTFDLTKIAQDWGQDSFDNNGVMLVPVVEAGRTWQVNLKVPQKADEDPANGDEYEQTKNRAYVDITYVPGEPEKIEEIEAPDVPGTTGTTTAGGTSTFPTSTGTASTSPLVSPSTDLTGASTVVPGAEEALPAPEVTEQAGFSLPQEQGPRMPAYVWLAIPLGLLALSAVRSVILEPVGGPRPDGVIASIRRRNAQRRGGALAQDAGGLLGGLTKGIKRGTGSIGKALSGATRLVRRKR